MTITGTGGVGKTRLSQRVAESYIDKFADGVWLVELSPVTQPDLVAQAAANTLDAPQQPGQTTTQAVIDTLRNKNLLLLLDNCEHVIGHRRTGGSDLADLPARAHPGYQPGAVGDQRRTDFPLPSAAFTRQKPGARPS